MSNDIEYDCDMCLDTGIVWKWEDERLLRRVTDFCKECGVGDEMEERAS